MCSFFPLLIVCGIAAWSLDLESSLAKWSIFLAPPVLLHVGGGVVESRRRARLRAERGPCARDGFEAEFAGCAYSPEAVRAAYELLAPYADFAMRRSDDLWCTLGLDEDDFDFDFEDCCARLGCSDTSRYSGATTESTVEGCVRLLTQVLRDHPQATSSNPSTNPTTSA